MQPTDNISIKNKNSKNFKNLHVCVNLYHSYIFKLEVSIYIAKLSRYYFRYTVRIITCPASTHNNYIFLFTNPILACINFYQASILFSWKYSTLLWCVQKLEIHSPIPAKKENVKWKNAIFRVLNTKWLMI